MSRAQQPKIRLVPPPNALAVLYARVSSKDQEREGFSIPAQTKLLESYAHGHQLVIAERFIDVETAKRSGRTGFTAMIKHLRANPSCRIVLVEKTDRLYRNISDWVTLDAVDIEIHFVKEGIVLSNDSRSSEKFIHGIKVLMAKNYVDNLGEESRKGMQEKAEEGFWPSQAPLGYLNVTGAHGKKDIAVDPVRAPFIRQAFERYAPGNISLKELTRILRDEGFRSRTGKPVPKSTVHNMLHNPLYCGEVWWHGKVYVGKHEALVSRELWTRVQAVQERHFEKRHRKQVHDFAFSGLVSCGHCGCSLVGELKKGRYMYYRCSGNKGRCPEPYTREESLDDQFALALEGLSFGDDVLAWMTTALRESHGDESRFHDEAVLKLQAEYKRLQQRIDAMYLDKLDGRVDTAFFDKKATEWRSEQARVRDSIAAHETANKGYMDEGILLLELAQTAGKLYQTRPVREKRRLLDFVCSNSSWANGKLSVTYRQPFDMLAETVATSRNEKAPGGAENDVSGTWLRMGSRLRTTLWGSRRDKPPRIALSIRERTPWIPGA